MATPELTESAWTEIEAMLPKGGGRGRPWRNHRQVVQAILWKLDSGSPWRSLPSRFGPWQTAYDRYTRWRRDGTWKVVKTRVEHLAAAAPAEVLGSPFGSGPNRTVDVNERTPLEPAA
jgi:transposase